MLNSSRFFLGFLVFMIIVYGWLLIDLKSCMQIFAPVKNRELGVLEVAQAIILVSIISLGFQQYVRSLMANKVIKIVWALFIIGMGFIFLEEIDYGLHYYDFMKGNEPYSTNLLQSFRNIHNQSDNNKIIKTTVLIPQIIIFGIVPFFKRSIGEIKFGTYYAGFYWTIHFFKLLLTFILSNTLSKGEIENLHQSQTLTEMQELAFYFMLLVFVYEFRAQFQYVGIQFMKNNKV